MPSNDATADTSKLSPDAEGIVRQVRDRYGRIARGEESACCGATASTVSCGIGYAPTDLAETPEASNLGLGCGAPIPYLALQPGETVLDLGSGGGLDVFLAARQVGPRGRVIGVDMTPDMIELATSNARRAGLTHVEFRLGRLEQLPVEAGTIDAVTSNCVINLVPDKRTVFREVVRVLRPGGRVAISDIVLDGDLPDVVAENVLAYVGCVAGAMRREAYFALLEEVGLGALTVYRDVDFLAASAFALPEGLERELRDAGIGVERLVGVVRSVTFGAVKP